MCGETMIYDCFTFFNELDILEGRLDYLYNTADKFVIVESNITFNGEPKPYNFEDNLSRFEKYMDKIIYLKYAPDVTGLDFSIKPDKMDFSTPQWFVENGQREFILEGLKNIKDDDIVMISDLDEIPVRDGIHDIKKYLDKETFCVAFEQDMFYYNFDQVQVNKWRGTVMALGGAVLQFKPQWFRSYRWSMRPVLKGGWHISYFCSPEKIQYKIKNFAHQEFNNDAYTDLDKIQARIDAGEDLFGRQENPFVKFDKEELPKDFYAIFSKYLRKPISYV